MIQKLQKMRAEKGFTLAELLVVILIIAILATLAIVFFTGQTQTAKDNVAGSNLRSAYSAAQNLYVNKEGSYGTQQDVIDEINEQTSLNAVAGTSPTGKNVGVNMTSTTVGTLRVLSGDGKKYLVKTLPNGADSTVDVPAAP